MREKFDYILFAGQAKDRLQPISAWKDPEEGIRAAYSLIDHQLYKYCELTLMPEDDIDVNEVIWFNAERSNENAE